jgi:hypothetical protein
MDMVDYRDGYGGLQRWIWWTTEMDMVDYTDGDGGLHR